MTGEAGGRAGHEFRFLRRPEVPEGRGAQVPRGATARRPRCARCWTTTPRPTTRRCGRRVAEQGWLGAAIPEEYGGLGLGHLELCVIAEELGRAVAPIPFASTVYFLAEAVMLAGTDEQKAELLPKIAAGEVIGCMATSEGPGALTPRRRCKATVVGRQAHRREAAGDRRRHRQRRPGAGQGERQAGPVPGRPGRRGRDARGPEDPGSDARRGAADLQGRAGRAGWAAPARASSCVEQVFDRAAVLLAFEQCGGADRCLEMAKAYALERYAFGRVIASYQAIKHKLADMYVKNELGPVQRLLRGLGAQHQRAGAAGGGQRGADRGLARPSGSPPRRTSRPTAASASPGRWTATSTTAARGSWAWWPARPGSGRSGWSASLERRNAA